MASSPSLIVLWIYIVLLFAGGLMGFLKAKSKISLITSSIFAVVLALCATGIIRPFYISEIVIGLLALLFGWRYVKGRKFMPAGLMTVLSLAAVILMIVLR